LVGTSTRANFDERTKLLDVTASFDDGEDEEMGDWHGMGKGDCRSEFERDDTFWCCFDLDDTGVDSDDDDNDDDDDDDVESTPTDSIFGSVLPN
jgi:hypothetical protein